MMTNDKSDKKVPAEDGVTMKSAGADKNVTAQIEQLEQQVAQARESERRALADYQNIVRRQQEDRVKLAKLASRELVEALIQPLDHLELAATQLNDKGLNMVVSQFWQTLNVQGLEKIEVMGKVFDPAIMEAVENIDSNQDGQLKVVKVVRNGYQLNGEVIQVAKVVVN